MSENQHEGANRRLSLITIDQILSGGSNVLIAVLAAHFLSVQSFGLFGIVFIAYAVVVGVYRALIADPMLVHSHDAEQRPGEVIGTSFVVAAGLAAALLVAGLGLQAINTQFGFALVVLAACTPLLVLQDLGRYLGFAFQRPARAIVLDATWLVIMVAAVVVIGELADNTLVSLIAAWGGSGALAGLLVFAQQRGVRPRLSLSWLGHTWRFSWRYLISYVSLQGSALAVLTGVGAIAGATARGGVQGTLLFIRPYTTFQIASVASGVGEISRNHLRGGPLRRHATKTTAITAAVALVNAIVMLVLPDDVGKVFLGNAWDATKPLLLPTCAQIMAMGLLTGARVGLLGRRLIHRALVVDLVGAGVFLGTTLTGAAVGGASGALWFGAAGRAAMTVVWWLTFLAYADGDQGSPTQQPLEPSEPATVIGSG